MLALSATKKLKVRGTATVWKKRTLYLPFDLSFKQPLKRLVHAYVGTCCVRMVVYVCMSVLYMWGCIKYSQDGLIPKLTSLTCSFMFRWSGAYCLESRAEYLVCCIIKRPLSMHIRLRCSLMFRLSGADCLVFEGCSSALKLFQTFWSVRLKLVHSSE